MPSLETTNWILAVIATATAAQTLMLIVGAIWATRRISKLQDDLTKAINRFEAAQLPELTARASDLMDDFHRVAVRIDRVGQEMERATRIAQSTLSLAGNEVERATRGVRFAFDMVEGGVRQAARVGAGVRAGLREVFAGRAARERQLDDDAVARFEAKA